MVSWAVIADQVITGISIGSQLFLVAVGLSIIFGVMDLLNFAHGVLYMFGAYMVLLMTGQVGLSIPLIGTIGIPSLGFWPGVIAAVVIVSIIGGVLEVGFIRRVYDRGHLDQLLLTFAFVLILTDAVRIFLGTGAQSVREPAFFDFTIQITNGLSIPGYRGFVILMSLVVLGGLFTVLKVTDIGRLVRATTSDRDMAALLGVDVPKLYTGVFIFGAALAGIGGALAAPLGSVSPETGNQVIINAFLVTVIGGLGSFVGAFVGAMIVGVLTAVGSLYITGAGQLMPFVVMILVLVVRPQGLFGDAEAT